MVALVIFFSRHPKILVILDIRIIKKIVKKYKKNKYTLPNSGIFTKKLYTYRMYS